MSQYKISKKRLAEIVKQELQNHYSKSTRRLNEDASPDTFQMVDAIVSAIGPEKAMHSLVQAMERSNAQALLGSIMQDHEIRMPGNEVEDYDPSAYNRRDDSLDAVREMIKAELEKL
jgi:hypothetical protein